MVNMFFLLDIDFDDQELIANCKWGKTWHFYLFPQNIVRNATAGPWWQDKTCCFTTSGKKTVLIKGTTGNVFFD